MAGSCSLSQYTNKTDCEDNGGVWTPASSKEYGYFLKGKKLALVEKDSVFDNDPNTRDYGPGTDKVQFKSPLSSVIDGLELEYTYVLDLGSIEDENHELDLPLYLQKALIYYMKSKDYEDQLDFQTSEYFMMKFVKQVEKFNNSRITGLRLVAPGPNAIR